MHDTILSNFELFMPSLASLKYPPVHPKAPPSTPYPLSLPKLLQVLCCPPEGSVVRQGPPMHPLAPQVLPGPSRTLRILRILGIIKIMIFCYKM